MENLNTQQLNAKREASFFKNVKFLVFQLNLILALPLVVLIRIYQISLSPDHSWVSKFFPYGYCKFHPSCSMYALIVLKTQGLIGLPKIAKRILSCNPFTQGGIDEPYPNH